MFIVLHIIFAVCGVAPSCWNTASFFAILHLCKLSFKLFLSTSLYLTEFMKSPSCVLCHAQPRPLWPSHLSAATVTVVSGCVLLVLQALVNETWLAGTPDSFK